MPLVINTNTLSLNAQTHLHKNTTALQKSMEKLASGFRINRAGDDAAGLQLSELLRAQARGAQKAADNAQDGINMLNIADGAMQVIEDNLQRIRELSVQAATATYSGAQRTAMDLEVNALQADILRIASATRYNGNGLLDGTLGANFVIQVGPNNVAANDQIDVGAAVANVGALGAAADVTTQVNARAAITTIDTAIDTLNAQRGALGAFVNRLESAYNNLLNSIENIQAAESRIRNVDVAAESATMIKYQVLQQSSALMLSQANQTPTIALSLLKG